MPREAIVLVERAMTDKKNPDGSAIPMSGLYLWTAGWYQDKTESYRLFTTGSGQSMEEAAETAVQWLLDAITRELSPPAKKGPVVAYELT